MAYRRRGPKGHDLQLAQKLSKFCNASAGCIPFEPHFAATFLNNFNEHPDLFKKFSQSATIQKIVPSRMIKESDLVDSAVSVKLPLPKYLIDPTESPDDFVPREFFYHDELKTKKDFQHKTLPRCGMTGLFLSREEVVDALMAASEDLGFSSPFWIKEDYQPLQSGFISLKDGSDAVVVSLTASVAGVEKLQLIDPMSLHYSLRKAVTAKSKLDFKHIDAGIPKGMNAVTGYVSRNPFIQSLPCRGLWISFGQLLYLTCSAVLLDHTFTLVEIDQLCLYNADQLTVPGRLGLKQRKHVSKSLFHPL